jgi:DNA-binding NarL/FixJ family response regulator
MKSNIKIAIVDDHPMIISGISAMLNDQSNMEIIATFLSGNELLSSLSAEQPDVLLIDILLPDFNGPELAAQVKKNYPSIKMVALTSIDTPAMVRSMLHNGCKSYLLKGTDKENLVQAIEWAFLDKQFIEPNLAENLLQSLLHPQEKTKQRIPYQLTKREKEILSLIISGATTHEIGDRLHISPRTVETHRLTLLKKLMAKNTAELVGNAFRFGIAE